MNILDNVSEEKKFVFADSKIARNARELCDKLKVMPELIFRAHVNKSKNEFSAWILENYHNHELSSEIEKCPRKGEILAALQTAITNAKYRKDAMLDGMIKKSEKEQGKLLSVLSHPKTEEKIFSIPTMPLFSLLSKKEKKHEHITQEQEIAVSLKQSPQRKEKRVLIDDVLASEMVSSLPVSQEQNSNIFKEEANQLNERNAIKPNKIQIMDIDEIISKIKEVHK